MPARQVRTRWLGAGLALALLPLQAGCGLFDPQPQLQAPPPAPARPARVVRPRQAEPARAADAPAPEAEPTPAPADAPAPSAGPPDPPAASAASPPQQQEAARPALWRVAADRTVGCAVPETVRMLRSSDGLGESQPRLAAQVRREGRCATTFRLSEWTLVRGEGDLVLLRLANPPAGVAPLELWFLRRDVVPQGGAGAGSAG